MDRYAAAADEDERKAVLEELSAFPAIPDGKVEALAKKIHVRLLAKGARSKLLQKGVPAKYATSHPEHEGTYYLTAPKRRGKPLPVLFLLHGGTQGLPGDDPEEIEKANLPPAQKQKILTQAYGRPCIKQWTGGWKMASKTIRIGPNQPGKFGEYYKAWDASGGALFLLEILKEVQRAHPVDTNRVYVAGISNGDYGVWNVGSFYPDVFAAFAGGAGRPTKVNVPNLFNARFIHYIGEKERPLVPFMTRLAKRFDQLETFFGGGFERVLESHPEIGHAMPPGGPTPLLDWMAERVRDPYPRRVLWRPHPNDRYPGTHSKKHVSRTTLFWLADATHLVLGERKDDNEIEITWPDMGPVSPHLPKRTGRETYAATVLLNRRMVDFKKPVRVTSEGALLFDGRVEHGLPALVESLAAREDLEQYFTARVRVQHAPR